MPSIYTCIFASALIASGSFVFRYTLIYSSLWSCVKESLYVVRQQCDVGLSYPPAQLYSVAERYGCWSTGILWAWWVSLSRFAEWSPSWASFQPWMLSFSESSAGPHASPAGQLLLQPGSCRQVTAGSWPRSRQGRVPRVRQPLCSQPQVCKGRRCRGCPLLCRGQEVHEAVLILIWSIMGVSQVAIWWG